MLTSDQQASLVTTRDSRLELEILDYNSERAWRNAEVSSLVSSLIAQCANFILLVGKRSRVVNAERLPTFDYKHY